MYNDAILSADNWRRNYDAEVKYANSYREVYGNEMRRRPFFFLAGMLTAALGILLVAQAFTV